jgi:hypothetical protein
MRGPARVLLATIGCLLAVATPISVAEAEMTVAQAVLLSSNGNPDDDLNVSYYIHGVIEGLLQTGAYRCKTLPNYSALTRQAKETARQMILQGKLGGDGFARFIAFRS